MIRKFLLPLVPIYRIIIQLRNRWYNFQNERLFKAAVPVISIGNISTGGTGKTPMTEYALKWGLAEGLQLAYLSRGYGRKTKGFFEVNPDKHTSLDVGDEALQIAKKFSAVLVSVCEDRREGIRRIQDDFQVELILLDDAFQHRKVQRSLDLIMIDANRLPWKDYLLPAGNLREPLQNISRADGIVVNKLRKNHDLGAIRNRLQKFKLPIAFTQPAIQVAQHFFSDRTHLLKDLSGTSCFVFSGIANPYFFEYQLREFQMTLVGTRQFPDHYTYQKRDVGLIYEAFIRLSKNSSTFGSPLILTTEKDYFRLRNMDWMSTFKDLPFFYVPMSLDWIEGEGEIVRLMKHTITHF